MNAPHHSHPPLSLRSYGAEGAVHRHDHVQIVLPMQGRMEIEVGGRGERLDVTRAAFVAPAVDHVQSVQGPNRFLILDCDLDEIEALQAGAAERLQRQIFIPITPALRRLIEFVDLSSAQQHLSSAVVRHCAPLLLGALAAPTAPLSPPSRLGPLLARIEAAPGLPWTAARMAHAVGLSVSRLHALFRAELQQTPQEWLSALRLRLVREALAGSDTPVAELALRAGYSEQSALTRAMRRATGMTPAAYRKQQRQ